MQVASGLCHSAFRETWSPSTVFFSRRNALGTLVLSTDIQIQEKFFLGALASLIHVEGVSVISRLKIASKRALYCFRLSEQCQQCQSYRANDWRWCFDSTFLHCALIKLFSSVLWFKFSTQDLHVVFAAIWRNLLNSFPLRLRHNWIRFWNTPL